MKIFLVFIGVFVVSINAQFDYGYTEDSPADKIKDNPGKCFVDGVGLMDKGAEAKVSGKCEKVSCLDEGKYRVKKCPPLAVEPPCYAVYPDVSFPECCTFKIECLPRKPTPVPPTRRN
ncbi:uncharacterized protein LOC123319863 isoform X2 [Coccinella septempunctata]|nr:uncharacterized protein LOC123319863 isoform X2 [Coccinella septempunctata]XP_044762817.1 uncharacterized protein LOC123319863 isoform X2 [Coccinella septempunctata]